MKKRFEDVKILLGSYSKKYIGSILIFLLVFSLVKIISFVTPVVLSNHTKTREDYGYLEYLISLGVILSIFINTGFGGAYPYFTLRLNKINFAPNFYFHLILGIILAIACVVLLLFNVCSEKYLLAVIIGTIFSIQSMLSAISKTHNRIVTAVLLDAGIYLILMLYVVYILLSNSVLSISALKTIFITYLLFLSATICILFVANKKLISWEGYKEILQYAYQFVISSFLIISLTGSTRVFIEHLLGLKDVGVFSFYFRMASIVVMIHQAVNIIFFSKMYQADSKKLDLFFSLFIAAIFVVSCILFFIIPAIGMPYFKVLQETYATSFSLYITLIFYMSFWISNALNENVVFRENLGRSMNLGFIFIILTMLLSMLICKKIEFLSLSSVVLINTLAIYISTEVQFFVLSKKGIYFYRNRLLNRILATLLCLVHFITITV